jgi:hypothetical protein
MADRVVLHIGVHKTGTTSIQRWATKHRATLRDRFGFDVYRPRLGGLPHIEFVLLCLRSGRNIHAHAMYLDSVLPSWQAETRQHIEEQLAALAPTMLVSAEGLAFLRHADKLDRLRALLGDRQVDVIVFTREREAFLRSYTDQIEKMGYTPSPYPDSCNYVAPDSWIADFDAVVAVYRNAFGDDRVTVLSYEDEVARYGSTIPALAVAAGLPVAELPAWDDVWLNASDGPDPSSGVEPAGRLKRALQRANTKLSGGGRSGA